MCCRRQRPKLEIRLAFYPLYDLAQEIYLSEPHVSYLQNENDSCLVYMLGILSILHVKSLGIQGLGTEQCFNK